MTHFWEEAPGEQSAMRLIFIIGSVWLMSLVTWLTVARIATITEAGLFFATQFALLAGSKLIQKSQETKVAEPPVL